MIGEITVIPQLDRSSRAIVGMAVDEIAAQGLRHRVGAAGTAVEGNLDAMLDAVRAIEQRLRATGIDRAVIELRVQLEPHPETLEHQIERVGTFEER